MLVVADEFVIVSASNDRQVKAIVDDVERAVAEGGYGKPLRVEGLDDRHWVLMDYGDVVVHVFLDETRDVLRARTPVERRAPGRLGRGGGVAPDGLLTDPPRAVTARDARPSVAAITVARLDRSSGWRRFAVGPTGPAGSRSTGAWPTGRRWTRGSSPSCERRPAGTATWPAR